jgi:hypothetical protein
MHPSHQRAREVLARRGEQEREHQRWRDQHHPEELLPTSSPRQLKHKDHDDGELVFKTVWNEPAPTPAPTSQPLDDHSWNEWASAHVDELGEEVDQVIEKLAKRVDRLAAQVKRLRKALKDGG